MKISSNDSSSIDVDNIYNQIEDKLNNIYDEFDFLNIPHQEYNEMCIDEIQNLLKEYSAKLSMSSIYEEIERKLIDKAKTVETLGTYLKKYLLCQIDLK